MRPASSEIEARYASLCVLPILIPSGNPTRSSLNSRRIAAINVAKGVLSKLSRARRIRLLIMCSSYACWISSFSKQSRDSKVVRCLRNSSSVNPLSVFTVLISSVRNFCSSKEVPPREL